MAFANCKKDNSWFIACKEGDMEAMQRLIRGNIKRRDPRSVEQGGQPGFTGLMYATMYCQDRVFEALYEDEWDLCTDDAAIITCKNLDARYNLYPGSNILFLAIASENQFALNHILRNPKTFLGYKNQIGYTATLFSVSVNSEVGMQWVFNFNVFINEIVQCSLDGMSVLSNCGYFGRYAYLQRIIDIVTGNPPEKQFQDNAADVAQVKAKLIELCTQLDSDGLTPIEVCEEIVDYCRIKTSEEQKSACHALLVYLSYLDVK